jgi:hypothetical protein
VVLTKEGSISLAVVVAVEVVAVVVVVVVIPGGSKHIIYNQIKLHITMILFT